MLTLTASNNALATAGVTAFIGISATGLAPNGLLGS